MGREDYKNSEGKRAKHEVASNKTNKRASNRKSTSYSNRIKYDKANKFEKNNNSKGKSKGKKALKIVLSIILTIVLIFSIVFGVYIYKAGGSIKGAVMNMVKDVIGEQDPVFVLIMGVSEDISVELTDTIMLAGYNPKTNQAFVLSIPRDTFIGKNEATAGGYDKINALYQKDPQKTVEAVENLTGVNIDYYVTVKTSALVEIVDAIDGVEFDVPINMDYDDTSQDLHIHLKAGKQRLNGEKAEQLVRFRHNNNGTTYSSSYGDNDEGRMRTQREFLKCAASQVIQWKNVDKIKEIASAVFNNLETNMKLSKMLGYVPYVVDFNVDDLNMEQLPGEPQKINELWFYKADSNKTKELMDQYIEKLGLTAQQKNKYLKTNKTSTNTTNKKKSNTTTKNTTNKVTTNNTKKNQVVNNTSKNETKTQNTTNNVNKSKVNTAQNNTITNSVKNEVKNELKNNTVEKPEKPTEKPAEKPADNTEEKPTEKPANTTDNSEKNPTEQETTKND